MKRIIILALLLLVGRDSAWADSCSVSYQPSFTGQQANQLCGKQGAFVSITTFETVAGAGTIVSDAAALSATKFMHRLTGANGVVGYKLPIAPSFTVGRVHTLLNTTAGVANIYPATGGTINGAAANAVFAALTGIKPIICIQTAALTWICA